MFRDLIPELAGKYHVVAPDLPGFGMTEQPARDAFAYTFENIAKVVGRFTEVLGLERFAIYVFDYGAPVGFRLALAASRAHHRDRLPERQHLPGRRVRGLRSRAGLLERADPGQPRRPAQLPGPADHPVSIHLRRERPGAGIARRPQPRRLLPGKAGQRRDPAGPARRLQDQRRPLYATSRPTCATSGRRCWPSGARTTRSLFRQAPRPSGGTSRRLISALSIAATSPWRPTPAKSAQRCATFSPCTWADPRLQPHAPSRRRLCLLFEAAERGPPSTEVDHDRDPARQTSSGTSTTSLLLATPPARWA